MVMLRRMAYWAGLLALLAGAALAQPADTILLDGKIITFDGAPAEALAVRGDRIVALGQLGRHPRARRPGDPCDRTRGPQRLFRD